MTDKTDSSVPASAKSKWMVTLGGGEWNVLKYGVVEYLRARPRMRATCATLGLLWVLGWLATTAGFKWHSLVFPAISTFFVTPTLLWLAVVSGPDFSLTFGQPKTTEPKIESQATTVKGLLDAESYGIEALNQSYVSTETYARSSFRWSLFSLVAGVAIAAGNVWLISERPSMALQNHTSLFVWIAASTFWFLCLTFVIRSMMLFRRASELHDRLLELQRSLTVLKMIDSDKEHALELGAGLIVQRLLGRVPTEAKLDQLQSSTGSEAARFEPD